MKKTILFLILILVFLSISIAFGYDMLIEQDYVLVFPCIIGLVGAGCSSWMLFAESVLGRKSFCCESEKLYVKRKNKIIQVIEKADVKNLVYIYDTVLENLHIISFDCNDKKHYITVYNDMDDIILFFDGIEHTKTKNHWYYLIEFFTIC